ncbi:hypothetical protein ACR2XL_02605 [Klebsiella pneumoniae]
MFKEIKKWFVKGVNYETEFIAAVKRSKKWKLEVPNITLKNTPFLAGERATIALKVIQHYASMHSAEEVSQQCFGYMYGIQNTLEDALQTPLYYTLGYVEFEKRPVFYTEIPKLERNLDNQVSEFVEYYYYVVQIAISDYTTRNIPCFIRRFVNAVL